MPLPFCCHSQRSASPPLPNSRSLGSSHYQPHASKPPHVSEYVATPCSSKGSEDLRALREIFGSSNSIEETPFAPDQDVGLNDAAPVLNLRREESSGRIQEVTFKIKKRLSRESATSKKSSRSKIRDETSEDDIKRRRELKRALHRRLKEELLADKSVSEGGYDTDAAYIETPRTAKEPGSPSVRVTPECPSNVLHRLQLSPTTAGTTNEASYSSSQKRISDHSVQYLDNDHLDFPARSSSRLHQWSHEAATATAVPLFNSNSADRNGAPNFEREVLSATFAAGTHSSEADDTFSAMQQSRPFSSSARKEQRTTAPPAPDLRPVRLPSISASIMQSGWRLSSASDMRHSSLPQPISKQTEQRDTEDMESAHGALHQPIHSLHGHVMIPEADHAHTPSKELKDDYTKHEFSGHALACNPATEEEMFGGIDEGEDILIEKAGTRSKETPEVFLNQEDGIRPVHLYNMRIPQLLASRTLLPTVSLPQMTVYRDQQRGNSSASTLSIYPPRTQYQRQTSSSGFASGKLPFSRGDISRDSTSSVYPSTSASLASSPRSSIIRIPTFTGATDGTSTKNPNSPVEYLVPNSVLEVSGAMNTTMWTSNEKDRLRRHTMDTTSFDSSTDSFRLKELAAAEARFASTNRTTTTPKTSKFKEDFEEPFCLDDGICLRRHSIATLDGSGEWYTSGKRQGFGYELVPKVSEGNASLAWERALKIHAEEQASISRAKTGGVTKEMGYESSDGRKKAAESAQVAQRGFGTKSDSSGEALSLEAQDLRHHTPPDHALSPVTKQTSNHECPGKNPTTSIASWSRFSSHDRLERSFSPAGELDQVTARDFAHEMKPIKVETEKRRFSLLGKKKSRSMTFRRNILKNWSRLYKSQSTDFRRFAGGHRSSIATGGILEYPELEILPSPSSPYMSLEELSFTRFGTSGGQKLSKNQESVAYNDEATASLQPELDANVWSELYEDCVRYPQDVDQISKADASGAVLQGRSAVLRGKSETPGDHAEYSTVDMRDSTLNFQALLQIDEVKAKERALRAAEEAWGV
ncbi:MAG: hypothetical protein M1830_007411 [Pleopsidium flavum]|nr:MAG: hypothetical protein M1830_007411 [Pleopsidium flavum]